MDLHEPEGPVAGSYCMLLVAVGTQEALLVVVVDILEQKPVGTRRFHHHCMQVVVVRMYSVEEAGDRSLMVDDHNSMAGEGKLEPKDRATEALFLPTYLKKKKERKKRF